MNTDVRLMKLDMDHRIAVLELTIDTLQCQLSDAAATQRQCFHYLVAAMVVFAFCMLVAMAPG